MTKHKRYRMIDIAKRANVSYTAVNHVLTGSAGKSVGVSTETAERIHRIANELGYVPNRAAQQMRGKKSGLIAVVGTDWERNRVDPRLLSWLISAAAARGFNVLATQTGSDPKALAECVRDYDSRSLEGLIFIAFGNESFWPETVQMLSPLQRVTSILCDPGIVGGSCVESDVADGVRQQVAHLHAQGRRKIVQLVESLDTEYERKRVQAFLEMHRELGRPIAGDEIVVATKEWSADSDENWPGLLDEFIKKRGADAVLADNDFGASAIIRVAQRHGVRVPEDLAVMGWGESQFAALANPRFTTVNFQLKEIASAALDMLLEQVKHPQKADPVRVSIKPKLIVRESA